MVPGSFARNWQLMKLARNWRPGDVGWEIVGRLLSDPRSHMNAEIIRIASELGYEEGSKFISRFPRDTDLVTVLEGFFLLTGITCMTEEEEGVTFFSLQEGEGLLADAIPNRQVTAAYMRGCIRAIAPEAEVSTEDGQMAVAMEGGVRA